MLALRSTIQWYRSHSVTVSHGTLNPVTQVRLLVEPKLFIFFLLGMCLLDQIEAVSGDSVGNEL